MKVFAALYPSKRASMRALFCVAALVSLGLMQGHAQPRPTDSPAYKVPVFVSDFELYSAAPKPVRNQRPAAPTDKPKPAVPLVYSDTDQPSDQARRFVDFFAATLVRTLQKKGFSTMHTQDNNGQTGALLRGVFAESDPENHIRRAILGAGSTNARFLLYVGVFNLARDPQPLYQLADPQPSGTEYGPVTYGPVITPNNFIPLAKYEIDKNPTEEDVQKICNQIAASLVGLLETNPSAFSH
jgi:hypothetical protein